MAQDSRAVLLLADREGAMLEELRRNGIKQLDLLIVENDAPLHSEGMLELLEEYPPLRIIAQDSAAVTGYLESACDAPVHCREEVTAVLPGKLQLWYQQGLGIEVSGGEILLLKFQSVYDIINQYEPDVLILPGQAAQIRPNESIRVRENTEQRTELLFWK